MINDMLPMQVASVAATQMQPAQQVNMGYGASLSDISSFQQSLDRASQASKVQASNEAVTAVLKPLGFINTEAAELLDYAKSAVASGKELTPSEIVLLTARSHEFMFHAQLTANVANRTAEGLQQLFRQQN